MSPTLEDIGDFVKDPWFMQKKMELGSDSSWMVENKVAGPLSENKTVKLARQYLCVTFVAPPSSFYISSHNSGFFGFFSKFQSYIIVDCYCLDITSDISSLCIKMPALDSLDSAQVEPEPLTRLPFKPVTKSHIRHCSYDYWHPK